MPAIFHCHSVCTGIIIRNIQQRYFAPRITIVTAPGCCNLCIARTAEYLQFSVLML